MQDLFFSSFLVPVFKKNVIQVNVVMYKDMNIYKCEFNVGENEHVGT